MNELTRIAYVKPSITKVEIEMVAEAMAMGWGQNSSKYIELFESGFAEFVGSKFAVATSSCTGAIELGLAALNFEKGDEVIIADTNWVATLSPILRLGLTPVFVDVCLESWTISATAVESAITSRTRAVIVTHLYGNCAEISRLMQICKRYGVHLIEDAAESLGTTFSGKHTGTFGEFGVFSFHGSKTLTTGEGGMLVTNSSSLDKRVRELNNHGRQTSELKQFWATSVGYKFKMTNMQAALGFAQLSRAKELINRKREILDYYRVNLANPLGIGINPIQENVETGAWMPNIFIPEHFGFGRDELFSRFKSANIDARVFFWPLSSLPFTNEVPNTPNSYLLSRQSINLPSYHDINIDELERVCSVVSSLIIQ
jgi:perosamine synthetase